MAMVVAMVMVKGRWKRGSIVTMMIMMIAMMVVMVKVKTAMMLWQW